MRNLQYSRITENLEKRKDIPNAITMILITCYFLLVFLHMLFLFLLVCFNSVIHLLPFYRFSLMLLPGSPLCSSLLPVMEESPCFGQKIISKQAWATGILLEPSERAALTDIGPREWLFPLVQLMGPKNLQAADQWRQSNVTWLSVTLIPCITFFRLSLLSFSLSLLPGLYERSPTPFHIKYLTPLVALIPVISKTFARITITFYNGSM